METCITQQVSVDRATQAFTHPQVRVRKALAAGIEESMAAMRVYHASVVINVTLPVNPVHVRSTESGEDLVYREADMVPGVAYPVKWRGRQVALRRTGDGVELLEIVADEK